MMPSNYPPGGLTPYYETLQEVCVSGHTFRTPAMYELGAYWPLNEDEGFGCCPACGATTDPQDGVVMEPDDLAEFQALWFVDKNDVWTTLDEAWDENFWNDQEAVEREEYLASPEADDLCPRCWHGQGGPHTNCLNPS